MTGQQLADFLRILDVLSHQRAHRHGQHQVVAGGAMHAAALAVGAARRVEVVLEAVVDERRHAGIGLQHHVAPMAAIAAVGAALGHMGLAAERHAACAAVAALHMYANLVDEHRPVRAFPFQWASLGACALSALLNKKVPLLAQGHL